MLGICLRVLTILGILLLILLLLAVGSVLLILFFPLSYRIQGTRNPETFELAIRARWLFGLVRGGYRYPEPGRISVKVLCFTLVDREFAEEETEGEKEESTPKKRSRRKKNRSEGRSEEKTESRIRADAEMEDRDIIDPDGFAPDIIDPDIIDPDIIDPDTVDPDTEDIDIENKDEKDRDREDRDTESPDLEDTDTDDPDGTREDNRLLNRPCQRDYGSKEGTYDRNEETQSRKKATHSLKKEKRNRKKKAHDRRAETEGRSAGAESSAEEGTSSAEKRSLLETVKSVCDKIRGIWENISYYVQLLQEDGTRLLLSDAMKALLRILKSLRPRRIRADIRFGTGAPDTTGYAYGAYCILSSAWGPGLLVTPDFEEKVLEGELDLSGRVALWVLLLNGLKMYKLIGKLKGAGKERPA